LGGVFGPITASEIDLLVVVRHAKMLPRHKKRGPGFARASLVVSMFIYRIEIVGTGYC
jgi:hypothetical protein